MDNFNALKEVDKIVEFIREYYSKNNLGGVILGISGGKDSAVVAGLFTLALGKENVIGLTLPCYSDDKDIKDAKIISDHFGFDLYNIDLSKVFDTFKDEIFKLGYYFNSDLKNSDINLKPRLRMSTLYYMAALFSQIRGKTYIVAGTGNKCEIFVGYFTKGGDGMSDINVLANYTVSEVLKIGEVLNVPKDILYKTPSDGLSNMSDEDKLGVSYKEIEDYIEGKKIDDHSFVLIKKLHENSKHKKGIVTI